MLNAPDTNHELPLELNEETLPIITQITDGMPGGFFIYHADGEEELIHANAALAHIFGCEDLDEFERYVGGTFRGMVYPEDLEEVEQSIHGQIAGSAKGVDYVEYRITRKDGVIRWLRDYGKFVRTRVYGDVFYVFVEDATERHLKELTAAQNVQTAKERLEILGQLKHETAALQMVNQILSSSVWSAEFDEAGRMTGVAWSEELRMMLGYHGEEDFPNVLESWSNLIHEDDREEVLSEFYATVEDRTGRKTFSTAYRQLTKDRGWCWFQTAGKVSRREDGTPMLFVGIFVDITHRRLTDEALGTQRRLLEDALRQTRQASRARSVFLSNMSHDLRTPMNAITGFATLATMSIDDRDQALEYMNEIVKATGDLQKLINDILILSRLESGDVPEGEACLLEDVLGELEGSVRAEALARGLELAVESVGLRHSRIVSDRQQMLQVLINVVGNGLKFTPPGGEVSVRLTESQGAPEGYGFYVFKIRDTGIGMDEDQLASIYEPSAREVSMSSGLSANMGLGLAITQNIVENLGGAMRVESEVGKGTEVTLSFQFRLAVEGQSA